MLSLIHILSFGGPFIIFATAFGNILRGEGAARESMIGNLIGTVVNIVLDPVMILGLGWGAVSYTHLFPVCLNIMKAYATGREISSPLSH